MLTSNYMAATLAFLRHRDGITISGEVTIQDPVERGELTSVRLRDRGLNLRKIEVQTLVGRVLPAPAQASLERLKAALMGSASP